MNQNQIKAPIVILRPVQLAAKKGISRTGQFELSTAGDFPKPVKLGARSIGFIESEVDDWILKRRGATVASAGAPSAAPALLTEMGTAAVTGKEVPSAAPYAVKEGAQ